MLILKCPKKNCKGHIVGFNYKGKPFLLANKSHEAEKITITKEIREKLARERFSEPFATFMDVIKEETEEKKE